MSARGIVNPGELVAVWAFRPADCGAPMIVDDPETIAKCFLKEMEVGEKYVIERLEMSRQALHDLPEHPGW